MSYQKLKEQLKSGELSGGFHFFGPEVYLKQHYTELLKEKLTEPETAVFNLITIEGSTTPDAVATAAETPPMMAEKKLIILKETGIFAAGAGAKDAWKAIFENWPPYAYILALEDKFDRRNAAYKAFSAMALPVEFAYRTRADLSAWVRKLLAKNKKDMSQKTLDMFLDAAGVDMQGILLHLEKLIAYVGARSEIRAEDVDALLVRALMTKEYVLTDALLSHKGEAAIRALSELWDLRTEPIRVLTVIASNYLTVLHAKALLEDHAAYPDIVAALRLPMPFLAKKAVISAKENSLSALQDAIKKIRETDYKIKLGMVEPKTGVTVLCAALLT